MEEGGVLTVTRQYLPPPKLVVPPRNLNGGFVHGGLNSGTPTPMAFFSSLFAEQDSCRGSKPLSELLAEGLGSPAFTPTAFYDNFMNVSSDRMDMLACDTSNEKLEAIESEEKKLTHTSLQSKTSAAYKAMMPSRLPIASLSAQLTISPGISPASLLESPILFRTQQADPSPTTGTLSLQPNALEGPSHVNFSEGNYKWDTNKSDDSFIFKPHPLATECGSPVNISIGSSAMYIERNADGHSRDQGSEVLCCSQLLSSDSRQEPSSDIASAVMEPQDYFELKTVIPFGMKPSGTSINTNARLSIDGYNWKKYGQKQLKNSENPRSYYKCSHPSCPAKRQVGRSQEGEITEIMYKGNHNHPKPQGNRRGARSGHLIVDEPEGAQNSSALWSMAHVKASGDLSSLPEVPQDGLPGTPEVSFTSLTCNDEDDLGETSIAYEDVDDEHDSKRRRIENEQEKPLRSIRENRVVVQTVSDVDILDDGYRWRKYGQKVVKGHCYPRNYYKCTNYGCTVKKHVERSSFDAKSVMTTYEGKHNHGVPLARGASRPANCPVDLQSLAPTFTEV